MKKLTSLVLATGMVLSLAACGGSGSSTAASTTTTDDSTAATDTAAADESNLGYEYGEHFHSDEPVTYTMFFNDNPGYPMNDKWINEGVFKAIEEATNVHLDLTVVDNSNYTDKVSLAVSSGTSPYIIPKIYSETAYVTGGGVAPVSDYVQYMPAPQIDAEFLGLTPEDAEKLQAQIVREFALWADTPVCDADRVDNFYKLQQLTFLSYAMNGDAILKPRF